MRAPTPRSSASRPPCARGAPLEAQLAGAYLQKARDTGDPSFYVRADGVLSGALERGPEDPAELIAAATLAAGRHDFRGALRLAERARALQPEAIAAYPVLVDALVELGRYGEAERTLQQFIDRKPSLPAYARVSYFRELHGDLAGAADAMARAASAGGGARENLAYVQTLLGDLELTRGRLAAARRAYAAALASMPGYVPALAGRARLAAASGDLAGAIAGWRKVVTLLPLPGYAIALGEAELAAGRVKAGRADLALVRVQERLLADAGVDTDVELAIYEADHGSRRRAVALAREAWSAAPSVRSADALGWALTRSGRPRAGLRWAHRALRLGSLDPTFRYHAGIAAGDTRRGPAQPAPRAPPRTRGVPSAREPRPCGAGGTMIRILVAALLALALLPAAASAHPLGNFSVNHVTRVSVSSDRVDVRYLLDEAEIPTFQQRSVADAELLRRKRDEVERRLVLTVDGRRVALRAAGAGTIAHPEGQGGLRTTRVELPLVAPVDGARRVELRDGTFPGRVGWKAVVVEPGEGTAVRSSVTADDPTNGLRSYPEDLLESPSDVRSASLVVRPGNGTVEAPGGQRSSATGDGDHGFADVFSDAAAGRGVLVLLLLSAFAWGAFHALSPGHGKAMVAAYLVGTRGTARHAVALGLTVTVTHTIGVFALGAVALLLSQYVLPEQLYPWLNLAAGALVLVVGAGVLRSRMRKRHAHDHHHHGHHHHAHGVHDHDHGHHHAPPDRVTWRGLLAMGAAAGLIPCPSALVVLLGAIAQGEIALGMVLIVAFSAGLAATLTFLGLAVVYAGRALSRLPVPGRISAALPTVSALLIVGVGLVMTVQALPQVA